MRDTDKAPKAPPARPTWTMLAEARTGLVLTAAAMAALSIALFLAASAQAVPFHARREALDVTGLNHACGAATDSKGDLYLASAGESKVNVYDPSHTLLTSISDSNTPCGLAVTTTGTLYVSEKATGEVVRFKPNAYPFAGTPTYGSREVIDASGKAKGIAVDPFDNRLYVAEGDRASSYDPEGNLGINETQRVFLFETTGGSFKLKFGGQETGPIKFDASAAEVKAALEALSSVGSGNVSVEKPQEVRWFVTFVDALGHADVEPLVGVSSELTGGVKPEVKIEETTKGWSGRIGEGVLTEATGLAPYSAEPANLTIERSLWVADAAGVAADHLDLFGGQDVRTLKLRRELSGATTPDGSFGFGAGAYLTADPGNVKAKKCPALGEQACTAGHLFLYDAAHKALDEFDGSGEYLDQTLNAAFADAEPTAVAIDRSGGANDGTLYLTAGPGAGAQALAFRPLAKPGREALSTPISHVLAGAAAVATDSRGYVYAATGALVHIYKPDGTEILTAGIAPLEDSFKPTDLAVDSTCHVYVLDSESTAVTYYTPSACPPTPGTTYSSRHEPAVAKSEDFPAPSTLKAIAVNPGPASGKDHLFVTSSEITREYDSATNGSGVLDPEFAKGLISGQRGSIAIDGASGAAYFGVNANFGVIYVIDATGKKVLARINTAVSTPGTTGSNPFVAVDQANGHAIEFDGGKKTAREYEAVTGGFVAEFGSFTEGLFKPYRVAVDNACAINGLTGAACEAFDPANGTVYVAFDDTKAPFDVTAFGPLKYGAVPAAKKFKLTLVREGTGTGKITSPENRFESPIGCPPACSAEFEEGTKVTLEAKADEGSEFLGWSGSGCSGTGTCKVTMTEAREVTASFKSEKTAVPLEVELGGPGSGKVTSEPAGIDCPTKCSAEFAQGSKVSLTATPDKGSKFLEWSGACSGSGICEVTMSEVKKVTAVFGIETPLLTVVLKGKGEGTVTSEPAGIDCLPECTAEFELNQEVSLEADPVEGSEFIGWGGACSGEEPICEVKMTEPKEVTATFGALPQVIANPAQPIFYDEATLRGEIDTAELATEYRFEYLTEEEYEANGETFEGAKHMPVGELAPAKGFVAVEESLFGLEEGTTYRFRLRAMNAVGPAEDEGAFVTLQRAAPQSCANAEYRTGFSAGLPDCRAYELVTPAQTNGLKPFATLDGGTPSGSFSNWFTVQHGPGAGEDVAYFTEGTLPGFEGNGLLDAYRAQRGAGDHPAGGWQSAAFAPTSAQAAPGIPIQQGIAADQLYSVWQLNSNPEETAQTLPAGLYLHTPAGLEPLGRGGLGEDLRPLSLFVSAGGAHVIFSSKAHLEPGAPPAGNAALYDRAAGEASANVLTLPPTGSPEEEAEFFSALRSKGQASFSGASEDGTAITFNAGAGLYVRLDDERTERMDPLAARVGEQVTCAGGPLFYKEEQHLASQREFQWLRNGAPIPGAGGGDASNNIDRTAALADEGAALQCRILAKEGGTGSVAVSAPLEIAPLGAGKLPQPPAEIAAPTPPSPTTGTEETCNPGSWQGTTSLTYEWYLNGEAIAGATAQKYKVQAGDVPGTIQCVVKGVNSATAVARASGLTPTSPGPAEAAPVATAQAAVVTTYAGTSEDGRYVFFALGNGISLPRLLRFDTQAESATEIAAAGRFAGISSDGSHAFFSTAEHDLYAWDGAEVHFVGKLATEDFENKGFADVAGMNLAAWTEAVRTQAGGGRSYAPTRSTPDGDTFVFQSHARLSGYDNQGVGEIYRYDPAAEAGEALLCVSCNPSGAPASEDALLEDIRTPFSSATGKTMIANVTDSGEQVFFQSPDRLLPEDANESLDVYEWMARGSTDCDRPGGCLALISSGQGEAASYLYAMSADGRDVFFTTTDKLVGADLVGSPSIYDARAGGGIPEAPPPVPCEGDACQGQGSEPPASATTGAGESPEGSPPVRKHCAKGKHRVKGRCVPKHKHKHRRAHANQGGNR